LGGVGAIETLDLVIEAI